MEKIGMEKGGRLLAGTINPQGKQEISHDIKDVFGRPGRTWDCERGREC
jgi:hypothetical protein